MDIAGPVDFYLTSDVDVYLDRSFDPCHACDIQTSPDAFNMIRQNVSDGSFHCMEEFAFLKNINV